MDKTQAKKKKLRQEAIDAVPVRDRVRADWKAGVSDYPEANGRLRLALAKKYKMSCQQIKAYAKDEVWDDEDLAYGM